MAANARAYGDRHMMSTGPSIRFVVIFAFSFCAPFIFIYARYGVTARSHQTSSSRRVVGKNPCSVRERDTLIWPACNVSSQRPRNRRIYDFSSLCMNAFLAEHTFSQCAVKARERRAQQNTSAAISSCTQ